MPLLSATLYVMVSRVESESPSTVPCSCGEGYPSVFKTRYAYFYKVKFVCLGCRLESESSDAIQLVVLSWNRAVEKSRG